MRTYLQGCKSSRMLSISGMEDIISDFDILWLSQDPAKIEHMLLEKLPAAQNLSGPDRHSYAELLTQLARAKSMQGKEAEAREHIDEAEKIINTLADSCPVRSKLRLLLEDGRLLIQLRTPSQARNRFSQAWALAVNADEDFFTVDLARMMALIEPQKRQEEWLQKAIEIAEQSKQAKARMWLGELYSDLGWRLFDLKQFEAAIAAHQSAVKSYKFEESPKEYNAKWAIGRVLREMGRDAEALAWYEQLELERGVVLPPDGRLFEEIAECMKSLKREDSAQKYFARAYWELSLETRIPDRHPLRLKRLKELGKV